MPRRKKAEIEAEKKKLEEEALQTGTGDNDGDGGEAPADPIGLIDPIEGADPQTGNGEHPDEDVQMLPEAGTGAADEEKSSLEEALSEGTAGEDMSSAEGSPAVEESSTGSTDSGEENRSGTTGGEGSEDAVGGTFLENDSNDSQTGAETEGTLAGETADTEGTPDDENRSGESVPDAGDGMTSEVYSDMEAGENIPVWEGERDDGMDSATGSQDGTDHSREIHAEEDAVQAGEYREEAHSRSGGRSSDVRTPARRRGSATGRRSPAIVAIDGQLVAETDASKARNDLLDLTESLKTGRILTGTMQGVEQPAASREHYLAVIYHGDYKVIIPSEEMVELPEDARDRSVEEMYRYLLNKRLGAEIDYIVRGIDEREGIAVASRLDAMKAKRKIYYSGTDRNGQHPIRPGICAEARVVSVIRAGAFVDLFGLETYIPLRELSYQRWMDAAGHFQTGQRILVKVLSVEGNERDGYRAEASVKQAGENPYEKALRRYSVGNRYVGTVSMVDTTGVFVALDGGIDCLCSYPRRGRPPRGARATVRILGINEESNRIWGAITHIAAPH